MRQGLSVGPFCLEEPLPSGPRGPAWLASEAHTGARVVVKFLTSALARDASWQAELRARCEDLTILGQRSLLLPLACSFESEPAPWIATPYVAGRSLLDHVGAPTDETIDCPTRMWRFVDAMVAVCRALDGLHGSARAHGGLAPSKVLFPTGSEEHALLLDAFYPGPSTSALEPADTIEHELTNVLEYLAPELLLDGRAPDPRSDVWSLGAMALEALVGRRPWSFAGLSLAEVRHKMRTSQPTRAGRLRRQPYDSLRFFPVWTMFHDRLQRPAAASQARKLLFELASDGPRLIEERKLKGRPSAQTDSLATALDTRLIGREAESAELAKLIGGLSEGRGGCVVLSGPAGTGKSALLREGQRRARSSGLLVIDARGSTTATTPAVQSLAAELLLAAVAGLRRLGDLDALVGRIESSASGPRPTDGAAAQHEAAGATLTALEALAAERACLVIIDDLHACDQAGIDLVLTLANRIGEAGAEAGAAACRVALLTALDPDKLPRRPLRLKGFLRSARERHELRDLGPLSDVEIEDFLVSELSLEPDEAKLVGRLLLKAADGWPAATVDLLKTLGSRFVLRRKPVGFRLDAQRLLAIETEAALGSLLSVSKDALEAARAKLAGIPPEVKKWLSAAAIWGARFDLRVVCRALGRDDLPTAKDWADGRDALGILEEELGQGHEYRFTTEALRTSLTENLPADQDKALSRRLAQAALDLARRKQIELDDAVVGRHFYRGEEYARAAPHLLRAAHHFQRLYNNGPARSFYHLYLDSLRRSPPATSAIEREQAPLQALLGLGEVQELCGRYHKAVRLYRLVESRARRLGLDTEELRAGNGTARALRRCAPPAEAAAACRVTLARASALHHPQGLAEAHWQLGKMLVDRRELGEAREHLSAAHDLYASLEGEPMRRCLAGVLKSRGVLEGERGDLDAAFADFTRALSIATGVHDRLAEAQIEANLGGACWQRDSPVEARPHFERAKRLYRDLGDEWGAHLVSLNLALCHARLGQRALAFQLVEEGESGFKGLGDDAGSCFALAASSLVLVEFGEYEEALKGCRRAEQWSRELSQHAVPAEVRRARAFCLYKLGRHEAAHRLAAETLAALQADGEYALRSRLYALLSRTAAGDRRHALALKAMGAATRSQHLGCIIDASWALAQCAHDQDDHAGAEAALQQALRALRQWMAANFDNGDHEAQARLLGLPWSRTLLQQASEILGRDAEQQLVVGR